MKSQEKYLLLVYTNELVKYDSIIRCTHYLLETQFELNVSIKYLVQFK